MITPCTAAEGMTHRGPTRAELGGLLGHGLSECLGRGVRIVAIESRPAAARSTHPIDRLQATLDSGERLPIIFKRLEPVPAWKGQGREALIYQRLLAGCRFGSPALYASVHDEAEGRYWLFLEDVGERTLKHADPAALRAAARWLAAMHGTYLGREEELRALDCLSEHGRSYYDAIAEQARENLRAAGAGRALERFEVLMDRFGPAIADLAAQPRTLVHGDIFPGNIALQPGDRIRPFDWESAAIGLPVWDLVRLLDGWGSEKPAFFALYLDTLERRAAVPIDRELAGSAFALCGALNILWHFGWSVGPCRDPRFVSDLLDKLDHYEGLTCLKGSGGRGLVRAACPGLGRSLALPELGRSLALPESSRRGEP